MGSLDDSKKSIRVELALISTITALLGGGCMREVGAPGVSAAVKVVSTVSPITNIVQNVGGCRISVTGIVPEGTNSHTFEPAPRDARVMAEADIVFINGLNLELPTMELAENNVGEDVPLMALGELTITPDQYIFDFSFPEEEGDPNPHLWTNPLFARRYAEIVGAELSRQDPEGADEYQQNFDRFAARLDELDRVARQVTGTVSPQNRKLLTYHDSFPYFAREYEWEIVGAIQPSDFTEPSPREVAALIDQVRGEGVPAIFGSEVFPSPVLEQIAAETGVEYVDELRDDDLPGSPGDPDHSYLGLMVFDFRTFMGSLGGDISPWETFEVENVAGEGCATYRE